MCFSVSLHIETCRTFENHIIILYFGLQEKSSETTWKNQHNHVIFEMSQFQSATKKDSDSTYFLNPNLQQQQKQKRISIPEMQLNPIKSPSKPPVLAT